AVTGFRGLLRQEAALARLPAGEGAGRAGGGLCPRRGAWGLAGSGRYPEAPPPDAGIRNRDGGRHHLFADSAFPLLSRLSNSSSESSIPAAATFSSRCETFEVPGMGSMTGLRFRTQASAIWLGAALW